MKLLIGPGLAAVVVGAALYPLLAQASTHPKSEALPALAVGRTSERAPSDTSRAKLAITGMTCGSCATTARLPLQRAEGVYRAEVSYDSASATVWYDPHRTSPDRFIARLRGLTGYQARLVEEPARREGREPDDDSSAR